MNIEKLKAIRDESMTNAILSYINSYDFTPRWNKYHNLVFWTIFVGWFGLAIAAYLGY